MACRKALLIGATDYGEGFASLPAVRQDLALMQEALERCQYEVESASSEVVRNGSQLAKYVRDFCKRGGPNDVYVIYFSGHGLRDDNVDWIIPSGVSRVDALESSSQRVSTDLSKSVLNSSTGLVIFVIDACRDEQDSPDMKSGAGWGDPTRLDVEEGRFIRFFGCRQGQVCHVLKGGHQGQDVSVFSKALADQMLDPDGPSCLEELLEKTKHRCAALAQSGAIKLPVQTPRFSYPETSSDTLSALKRPLFDRLHHGLGTGGSPQSTGWKKFEPNNLHCFVILSEFSERQGEQWGLTDLVEEALAGKPGDAVWQSFRYKWNDVLLVSGQRRNPTEVFHRTLTRLAVRSVTTIYATQSALDEAIRFTSEADLAVFDVTHFEPGVMLLLGVRAASKRGVTICSHGNNWQEGQPLAHTPFNLRDLNFNSHAKAAQYVGENPVVTRFVKRVETGFYQLSRQPRYLDLPVFDSLRQLGSNYAASSTVDIDEELLVLCSYGSDYFPKWEYVRAKLKTNLSRIHKFSNAKFPEIRRLVDIPTPQLVSQHLYERIRRLAGCLMDWTDFSPSAFLELGVRLSVSAWGVVQFIEESYEPGSVHSARLVQGGKDVSELIQVKHMRDRFSPIPYRYNAVDGTAFEGIVKKLLEQRARGEVESDDNRIHRIVADSISLVQEATEPVDNELLQGAEALHNTEQGRRGSPQVLFHRSQGVKLDSERAAFERRLAAWFYLRNRTRAFELDKKDPKRVLYEKVGRAAAEGLYELGGEQDIQLASQIEEQLENEL